MFRVTGSRAVMQLWRDLQGPRGSLCFMLSARGSYVFLGKTRLQRFAPR